MNKRNQILVTLSTFGAYSNEPYNVLKKSGFAFQSNTSGKRMIPEDVLRLGQNCMGIIAGVEEYSSELLSKLPNLCCISRCGSGIDNINLTEAKKRKIVILNTPDSPTIAVAELTLSMILSLLRQLPKVNSLMHERMWQRVSGNLLAGKVVGIIGLGRIGKRVAELVQAFQATTVAFDPFGNKKWADGHDIELLTLSELLLKSDIVTIHAAACKNESFFLGPKEFSCMKRGAWLINMARGDMVDENELNKLLLSGHLSGAGLDVYSHEPYSGPLCDNHRAILSPHQATLTKETRISMEINAVKNLVTYLQSNK